MQEEVTENRKVIEMLKEKYKGATHELKDLKEEQ